MSAGLGTLKFSSRTSLSSGRDGICPSFIDEMEISIREDFGGGVGVIEKT
jgi:hypothetical protein